MLFGDEKRFKKPLVPSGFDSQVMGINLYPSTDCNLGPGAYNTQELDAKRNGWVKNTFSKREPMTPPMRSPSESLLGRSSVYTNGVMSPSIGIALPVSKQPDRLMSPGPGYYDNDIYTFGKIKSVSF